ncbi:biopolymer transporter ExbB [Malaciobacter molluscorum LMG 25693]|uniref:Biopolymer transporter ExbB n=1 Tax=Malaciobacter molluscorum LMG 25693 TaxID=870501 RepID=A0A2G1DK14_9BACT|nr:MotA/TolQ/ExbB proton channel family protein [Malaciobacter molluscorum]AXX91396.1 TonB system transport protein ExbB [Malaciobacter molluscorum LMG 25693]PHO18855.1 biopolymer transporter ExbB [Malaciobacter molluscorum LMG 25693]RXJ94396.1 biopolymer transporter ExbB [Malaciobacter molluscorum]
MIDIYIDNLLGFFNKGGFVLYIVFAIALFLWALLIERYMYISIEYKKFRKALFEDLKNNQYEKKFKEEIKRYLIEDSNMKLKKGLSFIKTLIIVCPLVGLLGTVTGMIEVFDVMAINGTSNVKSMANGVSMATIPTMAGMVVALSGILFEKKLELSIKYHTDKLYLEISKVL